MDEKNINDILIKIEKSADDVCVPDTLDPENIKKRLYEQKELSEKNQYSSHKQFAVLRKDKKFNIRRFAEYAAAFVLVVSLGSAGIYGLITKNALHNRGEESVAAGTENQSNENDKAGEKNIEESSDVYYEKKSDIGAYHLAKSYDEVYQLFTENNDVQKESTLYDTCQADKSTGSESAADIVNQEESDYSKTNLQVEGVDENDNVKTDGKYIYVLESDKIVIADVTNSKMTKVGEVCPKLGDDCYIRTLYIDGNKLFLVVEKYINDVSQKRDKSQEGTEDSDATQEDLVIEDVKCTVDKNVQCVLQTYDITNRKNAKLLGSVTVDGNYSDSRKVGDYVYLFTSEYFWNIEEKNKIIPFVEDQKVPLDSIYVQDGANSEFIAVSVNANKPTEVVDQMVVMNTNVNVYMSTENIYLYSTEYKESSATSQSGKYVGESKEYTNITKFSYKDGYMSGVASKSVSGEITDTFAISEGDGVLRVLTTEWSENSNNRLYLLDSNMKVLGKLSDIAKGEEIYAARYIGNIVYFVTYHNTDPLFAVDISNTKEPKVLGQIKITGFSDYLHPYGEDKLLGIGYETDEETGECLGIKLTMFDISNPETIRVIDTLQLEGDYCSATGDYKSALVDYEKNIIGFEGCQWSGNGEDKYKYYVYSWENNHFKQEMVKNHSTEMGNIYMDGMYLDANNIRGLYIGEKFYLVYPFDKNCKIECYDMSKKFQYIDSVKL